jgi:homoserine acetyltransferase
VVTRFKEEAVLQLFSDCSEDEAQRAYALLEPHSQDTTQTPCDFVATDLTVPKTYVICESDKIVPLAKQERIAGLIPDVKVVRIAAGHNAFYGKSAELAALLVDVVEGRA